MGPYLARRSTGNISAVDFLQFLILEPNGIDYTKDRLFPLKARWETVDKILMVDSIWLVGSFKSLASKGPTNFYPC